MTDQTGTGVLAQQPNATSANDDRTSVAASFERILIDVLRRELDTVGLYPDGFQHVIRRRPSHRRIEMWLRTRRRVHAYLKVLDREWVFDPGAEIVAEMCTKFILQELHAELAAAGLTVRPSWMDAVDGRPGHGSDGC